MAMDGGSSGGSHSREYCLRWNNHQPNMVSFLSTLLPKESFADVTLVSAEGTRIQAHRIILSACSPYFEAVFESNPCKHPVVILKDVQYVDLRAIVSFIYNGEVNIEVDRINEIIQTATTLQVKGLAEVPADEFKRVSLSGRCSSPAENASPAPRSQAPPPLIMSSSTVRSWPATAEPSENLNDFPVRKKLKKSASANIPYSSGSSSTNGDVTNSTGSSFESGVGTSVSRSVDEGIGSDISSNDQAQSTVRPGPPPLTAANALLPKSRSLDDGYQRNKNSNNAEGAMETSGYAEHGLDDNGMGQDGGYDDIDVVDGSVKLEGMHHGIAYDEEEVGDEDDPAVDMTYYDDDNVDQYDGQDYSPLVTNNGKQVGFETPHLPLRKIVSKTKINRNNNNNNHNNNNANRQIVGVGHSLSLYRQQQPLKNFTSRAVIGKRRRGRPLLRQPRIKRLDNESSPCGGGRDDVGGGFEEQGYSSDTGEPYASTTTSTRASSSSCFDTQQQQHHHHQARSASVEHELYSTTKSAAVTTIQKARSPSPSPTPQMKPNVPIVRVSQCSPTPPGSPQNVPSPKSEHGSNNSEQASSHSQQHSLQPQSNLPGLAPSSSALSITGSSSSSTALLTVPTVGEPGSPAVRLSGSHHQGHLVKQVSTPLPLSHHHHYNSSEDEGGPSPSSAGNPVIRRQHSQPVQSSIRAYPSYSIVGRGQLFHILKSEQFVKDEESGGAYHLMETPMLQLVPSSSAGGESISSSSSSGGVGGKANLSVKEVAIPLTKSQGESISITLKEVGTSRSLTLEGSPSERPPLVQQSLSVSMTKENSTLSESRSTLSSLQSSEGQPVHRSGHCPALRPGPALGCNFCWNSVDSCGRVLRRKTKYFCPECHINLCIVPCFQEYHEKSDRKKKPRSKLGLPKPSSM